MATAKYTLTNPDSRPSDVTVATGSATTGAVELTVDMAKVTNVREIRDSVEKILQYIELASYPA